MPNKTLVFLFLNLSSLRAEIPVNFSLFYSYTYGHAYNLGADPKL